MSEEQMERMVAAVEKVATELEFQNKIMMELSELLRYRLR